MTTKELKIQLKRLEQALPQLSQEEGSLIRERLISRIKFYQFNQKPQNFYYLSFKEFISFLFHPWRIVKSFSVITLGLVLIVSLGIGTAVGANFADPGEALYNVKITLERMPLVLPAPIMSDQAKAAREMELAHNRQNEIVKIITSTKDNKQVKSKKIKVAVAELSRNIESAKTRVEKISQKSEQSIVVQAANTLREDVTDIKQSLDKVAKIIKDAEIDGNTSDDIDFAVQQASKAELSTLGVLIKVHKTWSMKHETTNKEQVDQTVKSESDVLEPKADKSAEPMPAAEQVPQLPVDQQAEVETPNSLDIQVKQGDKLDVKQEIPPEKEKAEEQAAIESNLIESDNGISDTIIKDQIIKDLDQAILDLEADLTEEEDIQVEQIDQKENLEEELPVDQPDQKQDVEKSEQPAEQQQVGEIQDQEINQDDKVVLNVEEVIAQEMASRQAAQRKERLQELIAEAKRSLEQGDLAASLDAVKQARELLGK